MSATGKICSPSTLTSRMAALKSPLAAASRASANVPTAAATRYPRSSSISSSSIRIRYSSSTTSRRGGVGEAWLMRLPSSTHKSDTRRRVPSRGEVDHTLTEGADDVSLARNMLKIRREGAHVRAAGVNGTNAAEDRMEFLLTLRRRGIMDPDVLRAMEEVPRGDFVGEGFAEDAYADRALPIACGQTISQPFVVAYMTEQLDVAPGHRVL